jgi:WD40 repeat protein
MTDEDALNLVDRFLKPASLGSLQEFIFRQVWNGRSYTEIANMGGYSPEYIKRVGAILWRSLSDGVGEKVTKNNVRSILRRYATPVPLTQESDAMDGANPEPWASGTAKQRHSPHYWGDGVDTTGFCGRREELAMLQQWIVADRCRLVALFGMGGVGKTALAAKLVEQIQGSFEVVVWRSLRHAPDLEDLLRDLVLVLSHQKDTLATANLGSQIAQLMQYLRDRRCLLILDNGESILQDGTDSSLYRDGYEGYGDLLRQWGQEKHQSCLLLTSRELPPAVAQYAGEVQPTRSLRVGGLALSDAQALLHSYGAQGVEEVQHTLIRCYEGNPLALKIALTLIGEMFDHSIAAFLEQETVVFGGVRRLLDQQFQRLSALEQQVMYWLCINREPVSALELQSDLFPPVTLTQVLEALESLVRRSLIERFPTGFSQQSVLMEYVSDRLMAQMRSELSGEGGKTDGFLQTYALMKASGKVYVREAQIRVLMKPITDWLLMQYGSVANCQEQLRRILESLRSQPSRRGYGGGNLVNLLRQLGVDFSDWDFSDLAIWQANLCCIDLHRVNFSGADLSKSVFTQTCGGIVAIAFHPDGDRLATADTEGQIHLWQVSDGQLLQRWKAHPAWASTIAFSPDGEILASGGLGDAVKLWHVSTRQCLKSFPGHKDQIWSIGFSPDGQQLAVADYSPTIRIWNVQTGGCDRTLEGHSHAVWAVVWTRGTVFANHADDLILISGSLDHTIKVWDLKTGACLQTLTHSHQIKSLAVSPDGTWLAAGSVGSAVRLWNLQTGEAIAPFYGHTDQTWGVAFHQPHPATDTLPHLITGSFDQTIRVWDIATGACLNTLKGHTNAIWAIAPSPNGQLLASGGLDHAMRVWEIEMGRCLQAIQGYSLVVWAIAHAPPVAGDRSGPSLLASGGSDHRVRVWDASTGAHLNALRGHQSQVWSVAFHPNGQLLASGSLDHTIKLWEVRHGRCRSTLRDHSGWVPSVAFSPNGKFLVSGSTDRTVRLWDLETGDCIQVLTHPSQIWSVAVTPDSQQVISGCLDRTIRLWDLNTGDCIRIMEGHGHMVWAIALSPDGRTLASGSLDNTVKLWDVASGECLHTLEGHTNQVVAVAFSPDGQTVASGGTDQLVKLWDVQRGECLQTLRKHRNMVRSLSFHPQGHHLASASADETIRLWNCQTWNPLQVLRSDRPYEGMKITDAIGLTEAQQENLISLGAIAYKDYVT